MNSQLFVIILAGFCVVKLIQSEPTEFSRSLTKSLGQAICDQYSSFKITGNLEKPLSQKSSHTCGAYHWTNNENDGFETYQKPWACRDEPEPLPIEGYFCDVDDSEHAARQERETRHGQGPQKYRCRKVPYVIGSNFTTCQIEYIKQSMEIINNKTKCISFSPRYKEKDYVEFFRSNGGSCTSHVGRVGGRQYIQLPSGCFHGNHLAAPTHEILHALGFFHEHTRSDRSDFIVVNYQYLQEGMWSQFNPINSLILGPYDLRSVMHYPAYVGNTGDGQKTMTSYVPTSGIGGWSLSSIDVRKIRRYYSCT